MEKEKLLKSFGIRQKNPVNYRRTMITANPLLLEKARDSRHQVFKMSRTLLWSFIVYNKTDTSLTCYLGTKNVTPKIKESISKSTVTQSPNLPLTAQ